MSLPTYPSPLEQLSANGTPAVLPGGCFSVPRLAHSPPHLGLALLADGPNVHVPPLAALHLASAAPGAGARQSKGATFAPPQVSSRSPPSSPPLLSSCK